MACKEDSEYDVTTTNSDDDSDDEGGFIKGLTPFRALVCLANLILNPTLPYDFAKRVLGELNMEMVRKIEALNHLRDIRDEYQKQSAEAAERLEKSNADVEELEEDVKRLQKKIDRTKKQQLRLGLGVDELSSGAAA
jgi:TolA-binding protein